MASKRGLHMILSTPRSTSTTLASWATAHAWRWPTRVQDVAEVELISGMVIGRLTLIERFRDRDSRGNSFFKWKAKCSCGNHSTPAQSGLKHGKTKSCGCLMRERAAELLRKCTRAGKNRLPAGHTAFNQLYYCYRAAARVRKREFNLGREEFRALVTANCTYCGFPPRHIKRTKISTFTYNGIDRIDNAVGYVPGNVETCCADCNNAKGKRSKAEFLSWLARFDAQRTRSSISIN